MVILLQFGIGLVFGLGLLVSGMSNPAKVLNFLDLGGIAAGNWDPSLAFVMAGAVAVTSIGYRLALRRAQPLFGEGFHLPTKRELDVRIFVGPAIFGIGWGLVGLCPGPAIANLATLSSPVIVFVVAMAVGTLVHDLWYARGSAPDAPSLAQAKTADG